MRGLGGDPEDDPEDIKRLKITATSPSSKVLPIRDVPNTAGSIPNRDAGDARKGLKPFMVGEPGNRTFVEQYG